MASIINAALSGGLVTSADTSGILQLQTASTTAVTVDASQNVGIGTSSPSEKLTVNGNIKLGTSGTSWLYGPSTTGRSILSNSDSTAYIAIYGSSYGSGVDSFLQLTSGTTSATVLNANGALSLAGAVRTATGVGITFPATQSASSNANTLDDYEEGTWTPELVGGTTAGTPVAGTGYYTKVGNLVTIFYRFEGVSPPSGAAGTLFVRGMPFTLNSASTIYSYNNPGLIFTNSGTSLANMWWSHRVDETVNTRWSFQYTANANTSPSNLNVSNMAATGNFFRGYFSYQV